MADGSEWQFGDGGGVRVPSQCLDRGALAGTHLSESCMRVFEVVPVVNLAQVQTRSRKGTAVRPLPNIWMIAYLSLPVSVFFHGSQTTAAYKPLCILVAVPERCQPHIGLDLEVRLVAVPLDRLEWERFRRWSLLCCCHVKNEL